jgi:hypothetical protein
MKQVSEILSGLSIDPEYHDVCEAYCIELYEDFMKDPRFTPEENVATVIEWTANFHNGYKQAIAEGYGKLWSGFYARWQNGSSYKDAKTEAYAQVCHHSLHSEQGKPITEHTYYKELFNEYLRIKKDEASAGVFAFEMYELADREKVEELMTIFHKTRSEGKSVLYSRIYAEQIIDPEFPGKEAAYAEYYEEAILAGKPEHEAYSEALHRTESI